MTMVARLDDYVAFEMFSRYLNFTRAATRLHISQPALHVKVKNLERSVGKQLYTRHGRVLQLTVEGEQVAAFARETAQRHARLLNALNGDHGTAPLRVESVPAAFDFIIDKGIQAYVHKEPRPLSLLLSLPRQIIQDLQSGEVDLGVVPDDTGPGLTTVLIRSYRQVAVMSRSHRLARRASLRLEDLAFERLIVSRQGGSHRESLSRCLAEAGVPWEVALETDSAQLMHRFAEMGEGIAIRTICATLPPTLVGVPVPGFPPIVFNAMFCPEATLDPSLAELIRLICSLAPPDAIGPIAPEGLKPVGAENAIYGL
jgi:LysR family transcriptional regulator, low CO2-responsive transcriptional regulator